MKLFLFCLVIILATGCKPGLPADVMPPEKMKMVQWDLMQADEMVEFYSAIDSIYPVADKRKELYAHVLQLHKISQQQLDKSLDYYTAHPHLLKKVLDSMQIMGERLQNQAGDTAPTKILPVTDSTLSKKLNRDSLRPVKMFRRKPN